MTDDQGRQVAAEIERGHPQWVVFWGCYSRLFWAFPYFQVAQGTIVSAPDRDVLLAGMRSIELTVGAGRTGRFPLLEPPEAGRPLALGSADRSW
ncbi:MAG: hypothetical protein ABSB76_13250 [Streptosporangiaceae bacterium]|jgi:hypothetical protein